MSRVLLTGLVVALLSACGTFQSGADYIDSTGLPPVAELADTPFYPDSGRHCGPAALATLLTDSGAPAEPDVLAPSVFIPGRGGALQAEMLATARQHGRLAYVLPPRLDAVLREVRGGRPVLVLQQLGGTDGWHYAVVVGYDAARAEVVLRSGTTRRLVMPLARFDYTWRPAGRWSMVVLEPGDLPAEAVEAQYLNAAAAFARNAPPASSLPAWDAALELWPRSLTALIGRSNTLYASGRSEEAIATLERAVSVHPHAAPAHNNLAHMLGEAGFTQRALRHATRAVSLGGPNVSIYRETLETLRAQ